MPSFSSTRLASSLALAVFVASTAACTTGTTTGGAGTPAEQAPSDDGPQRDEPSTSSSPPADEKSPPTKNDDDPAPAIDKTVHFELSIGGETIDPDEVVVTLQPASGGDPATLVIKAHHEQQLNGPFTSTATFTMKVDVTEKGKDLCGEGGRYADYWFKDPDDGALRAIGTGYVGGSCSMNVIANQADGFWSGTATGTLGGATSKSFTVSWGQNLPK